METIANVSVILACDGMKCNAMCNTYGHTVYTSLHIQLFMMTC